VSSKSLRRGLHGVPAPHPGGPDVLMGTLRTLNAPRGTLETRWAGAPPAGAYPEGRPQAPGQSRFRWPDPRSCVMRGTLGALNVLRGTLETSGHHRSPGRPAPTRLCRGREGHPWGVQRLMGALRDVVHRWPMSHGCLLGHAGVIHSGRVIHRLTPPHFVFGRYWPIFLDMRRGNWATDPDVLLTASRHGAIKVATLAELGVPQRTAYRRCKPGAPWQRLLPGVVLLGNLAPTRRQLVEAALLYAGPKAVLTGLEACRRHGLRNVTDDHQVHLLVPHGQRAISSGHVVVERTRRMPDPVVRTVSYSHHWPGRFSTHVAGSEVMIPPER
jgi:hypothetical protein